MIVVDSSVAAKWLVREGDSEQAEAIVGRADRLIAPDLILVEVANALWAKRRRGEIALDSLEDALLELTRLIAHLVPISDLFLDAWHIAVELDHPVYDCVYVALASRSAGVLVTADNQLAAKLASSRFAHRLWRLGTPFPG